MKQKILVEDKSPRLEGIKSISREEKSTTANNTAVGKAVWSNPKGSCAQR